MPANPLSILIAEDSPDNRLLLKAYLNNTRYVITFAENGEQALQRFSTGSFDMVLMDIQMPLMDGLSATRAIRTLEKRQNCVETPVIALTANALAHDVEASRLAGCNAHLSKPISKQRLLNALEEYRRNPGERSQPQALIIEPPEGLEELVPVYLASRKSELVILSQLLNAADFTGIRRIAHNLKGTGSSFGFPEISSLGAEMQLSASQASKSKLTEELERLSQYLNRVQVSDPDTKSETVLHNN